MYSQNCVRLALKMLVVIPRLEFWQLGLVKSHIRSSRSKKAKKNHQVLKNSGQFFQTEVSVPKTEPYFFCSLPLCTLVWMWKCLTRMLLLRKQLMELEKPLRRNQFQLKMQLFRANRASYPLIKPSPHNRQNHLK